MRIRRAARHVMTVSITLLLGGVLGATLVRLAPGFGVDELELDTRLSRESLETLRQSRAADRNIIRFYGRYLVGLSKGDLGISRVFRRPIAELLAQRVPVTLRSVAVGLALAWLFGTLLAAPAALQCAPAYDLLSGVLSGAFLCVPSAVFGLLLLYAGRTGPDGSSWAAALAIAMAVFPKVFRYVRNLLAETYSLPHVLTARAKGLSPARILLCHVVPLTAPQVLALAGVSVTMAFGAALPVEVICDSPGIGQLAWQAAQARDLLLLVNLTVLIAVVTLTANAVSDFAVAESTAH